MRPSIKEGAASDASVALSQRRPVGDGRGGAQLLGAAAVTSPCQCLLVRPPRPAIAFPPSIFLQAREVVEDASYSSAPLDPVVQQLVNGLAAQLQGLRRGSFLDACQVRSRALCTPCLFPFLHSRAPIVHGRASPNIGSGAAALCRWRLQEPRRDIPPSRAADARDTHVHAGRASSLPVSCVPRDI